MIHLQNRKHDVLQAKRHDVTFSLCRDTTSHPVEASYSILLIHGRDISRFFALSTRSSNL